MLMIIAMAAITSCEDILGHWEKPTPATIAPTPDPTPDPTKPAPIYTAPVFSALTYTGAAQDLVSAGTSEHGTFSYSTSEDGTYTTDIPQGTDAGDYTVWYKVTGDANHSDIAPTQVTGVSISKADFATVEIATISSKVYTGSAITPTPEVTLGGNSIAEGANTFAYSYDANINVGTAAKVILTPAASGNFTGDAREVTFTICASASSVTTAPAAVLSTLTYSGSAQNLVTAGTASGGTMKYFVNTTGTAPNADDAGWTETVPTGTNAGTYYIWYYVAGDANHGSTEVTAISGTSKAIGLKALTITAKDQTIAYGSAIATGTTQVTPDGLVAGDALTAVTLTPSTDNVTTTGTITPSAAATTNGADNYDISYVNGKLTITAVTANVTTAPAAVSSTLTYSGSAQALITAGVATGGTLKYFVNTTGTTPTTATGGWTTTLPTGTNAGTYYVWYYVESSDANHTNSAVTAISGNSKGIAKYTPTWGTWSNNTASVNVGSSFARTITLTGVNSESLTVTYSSSDDNKATVNASGQVSGVAAGSVTITASYAETTNYNAPTSQTYDVTVIIPYTAMSSATSSHVGQVICTNGHIHAKVSEVNCGGTASAIIAYVGTAGSVDTSSETYKGLAIALTDASSTYQWYTAQNGTCVSRANNITTAITYKDGIACTSTLTNGHSSHTHAAATAAKNYSTARPTTGVSEWFLPSMGQWNLIVQGLATKKAGSPVSDNLISSTSATNDTYKSSNLNSVITAAGGTGFQSYYYWSSTEYSNYDAWRMDFSNGRANNDMKTNDWYVRSVFAF